MKTRRNDKQEVERHIVLDPRLGFDIKIKRLNTKVVSLWTKHSIKPLDDLSQENEEGEQDVTISNRLKNVNNTSVEDSLDIEICGQKCIFCTEVFEDSKKLKSHILHKHIPDMQSVNDDSIIEASPNRKNDSAEKKIQNAKLNMKFNPTAEVIFQDESYECSICKNSFKSASERNVHVRTTHLQQIPFECPKCCVRFRSIGELSIHLELHK